MLLVLRLDRISTTWRYYRWLRQNEENALRISRALAFILGAGRLDLGLGGCRILFGSWGCGGLV